jgi:hypothetical protein
MSAINPNDDAHLLIDEFIKYAQEHLKTVEGTAFTMSSFPAALGTPLPGIVKWKGYFVEPSQVTATPDKLKEEEQQIQNDKEIQEPGQAKDPLQSAPNFPVEITTDDDGNFEVTFDDEITQAQKPGDFNKGNAWPPRAGGGSFSGGSGGSGGSNFDISKINLNEPWLDVSCKFIIGWEGFDRCAKFDENAPRLGYGSDMLWNGGNPRRVVNGDCTTKSDALLMLRAELSSTYKSRLVGSGEYKLSDADFTKLTSAQKAALLSCVYNFGSFYYYPHIIKAIKAGDIATASRGIKNGPVKGAGSGKVYSQLVERRAAEAQMMLAV